MQPSILIVGAGIGGLTVALALQRAGHRPLVIEASTELGEAGAGLTVAPNGSRILEHLGLGELIRTKACIPRRGAMLHYQTDEELVSTLRGQTLIDRYGAPYCQLHRADLHDALRAAVETRDASCILTGYTLTGHEQRDGGVIASFADQSPIEADLLIGADGIHSAVRTQLFGAERARFAGFVAWRGLVPMRSLPDGIIDPDSAVWLGPEKYLLRYRVRAGELLNYVAVCRCDEWAEEGWSVRSTVDAVVNEFADFCPRALTILRATPPDEIFRWGIFDREPLPRWSAGSVTLLGDAAHPTTPFLGQGAVMAMEDAIVLARAVSDSDSIADALNRYEAARLERTAMIQQESRANGKRMTGRHPGRYTRDVHRNEDTLDLGDYDAMRVPV